MYAGSAYAAGTYAEGAPPIGGKNPGHGFTMNHQPTGGFTTTTSCGSGYTTNRAPTGGKVSSR